MILVGIKRSYLLFFEISHVQFQNTCYANIVFRSKTISGLNVPSGSAIKAELFVLTQLCVQRYIFSVRVFLKFILTICFWINVKKLNVSANFSNWISRWLNRHTCREGYQNVRKLILFQSLDRKNLNNTVYIKVMKKIFKANNNSTVKRKFVRTQRTHYLFVNIFGLYSLQMHTILDLFKYDFVKVYSFLREILCLKN